MLIAIIFIQVAVLLLIMFVQNIDASGLILIAGAYIALKLLVVFAILLFFSTFSSPLLSIFATIAVYVSAHSTNSVLDLALRSQNTFFIYGSKALSVLLPNFSALSFPKNILGSPLSVGPEFYVTNTFVALGYVGLTLILTIAIFARKKFESV
jgi:hypothetical protein